MDRVPSDLRIASILATCLATIQAEEGVVQSELDGSVSKTVFEVVEAVRVPRVGEVRVTFWPLTLTTPTKSSMRSSWLPVRLELRGRLKAERTWTPAVVGVKVTVMVPFVTVMELFRLKSTPRPIFAFAARVMGNGVGSGVAETWGLPETLGLILQIAPTTQVPETEAVEALVMVAVVLLRKVICGLPSESVMLL